MIGSSAWMRMCDAACFTVHTWMRDWNLEWNLWPFSLTLSSTLGEESSHVELLWWILASMMWILVWHQREQNVMKENCVLIENVFLWKIWKLDPMLAKVNIWHYLTKSTLYKQHKGLLINFIKISWITFDPSPLPPPSIVSLCPISTANPLHPIFV